MQHERKEKSKLFAMITYFIAFLCIVAFWLVPAGFKVGDGGYLASTMAGQIYPAIGQIAKMEGAGDFTANVYWNVFGLVNPSIDFGAWIVLALALVSVAAIAVVVVEIACKKDKPVAAIRGAALIEVLVLAILSVLLFAELYKAMTFVPAEEGATYGWNYVLLIGYAGPLVMLILNGFIYGKHASGLAKFFVFVLSTVAVLLMFDLSKVFALKEGEFANILASGFFTPAEGSTVKTFGIEYLNALLSGNFEGFISADTSTFILQIGMFIVAIMVFFNFIYDLVSMGKTTRKYILAINLIRYILEVIGIALVAILGAVVIEGYTGSMLLWVASAIAVVQLILNIIRLAQFPKKGEATEEKKEPAKDAKATSGAEGKEATSDEAKNERRRRREATAADSSEEKPRATFEAPEPVDYSKTIYPHTRRTSPFEENVIYSGPTDSFIDKLSNCEKAEFAKVFLAERAEPLARIPEYRVGGENGKFFSSIFIYYARVCDLVSDGLMQKLYMQANIG